MNRDGLFLIGALGILFLSGVGVMTVARGITNKNYLNIKWSARNDWVGQTGKEKDGPFAVFSDPLYSIRAATKILNSYKRRGVETPRTIISTWAPPTENDTRGYIAYVAKATGLDMDARLSTLGENILLKAMIKMEVGKDVDLEYIGQARTIG